MRIHALILAVALAGSSAEAAKPVDRPLWSVVAAGGPGVTFFTDSYTQFWLGVQRGRRLLVGVDFGFKTNRPMTTASFVASLSYRFKVSAVELVPFGRIGVSAFHLSRELLHVSEDDESVMHNPSLWVAAFTATVGLDIRYVVSRRWAIRAVPLSVIAYYNQLLWGAWEPTFGMVYSF